MTCESCGFANAEAARFCGGCGAELSTTACRACNAPQAPGLRFCTSCGAPADGATAPAIPAGGGPAGRGPERRRISVMFVDLEGFTGLAESLDPEEVRSVQSRYFEAARAVVTGHGGTIEKFIGDAVMAVWGAPMAHEDDAERAVRAAMAIVDAVSRLGGAASDRGLQARAAVATGEAAVSVGSQEQGMVAGDMVNVAARLQSLAPAGGVLVDSATRNLAPNAAGYEPIGTLSLKGRSAGVAAFRAGERTEPAAGGTAGAESGPFVGRERELRELTALYEAVARDGLSRLVSITGIAGIGKSRLVRELGEWVDRRPEAVAWHVGRAPAYGERTTFAAVAEMVRQRIRVPEDASPGIVRRALAATLSELVRDVDERAWMEPRVAVLLGRGEDHPFDRDELFAAWRRFFERVSDRSPVVLVFEDLHWADPALLDFVEHLANWTREHPILIGGLARPEMLDHRPGWGTGINRFTSLRLERLSDAAVLELLAGRAGALTDAVTGTILERAGGVPLYAVEVVRVIGTKDTPASETPEIPDSLAGVIAARIDQLPPPERQLLLSAAVLGRRFRPEALIAISATDPTLVRERVEALVRRDLLAVDDELGSPGRGGLAFVQDLVRDAAYRTLGHDDRRRLHIGAARYLESRRDDDAAELLAHHLLEAVRLAPQHVDAPRLARRAVGALRTAAKDAMRLHVPERALRQLEQALRMTDVPEHRVGLLEEAAAAARAAARLEEAEEHLRALVALHDEGSPGAARARAQLASVLLMAQRNQPALAELETAIADMADADVDAGAADVAAQVARARMLVGDDRAGVEWADRAIATADRLGMRQTHADAIVTRGTALVRLGQNAEGLAELARGIELARAGGMLATELRARNNLAWLVVADDPRSTLLNARAGLDLATEMGVGDMVAQLTEVATAAAVDTGDWAWALEIIGEITSGVLPDANRINLVSQAAIIGAMAGRRAPLRAFDAIQPLAAETDEQVVSSALHARAWIAFVSGAPDEARRLAAAAAQRSFGVEHSHHLALEARAAAWAGNRDAAAAALSAMERLPISGRAFEAATRTLSAGLAALDGEMDPSSFVDAIDAWRVIDLPLPLAMCMLDARRWLGTRAPAGADLGAVLRALDARGLERLRAGVDPGAQALRIGR